MSLDVTPERPLTNADVQPPDPPSTRSEAAHRPLGVTVRTPPPPERIQRFDATERAFHWAQALPYLVCMITGGMMLALADGEHAGTRSSLADVHKVAGAVMLAAGALVVLLGDRRSLRRSVRLAFTWSRADRLWLVRFPLQALGYDVEVPPVGKYNPGQKLNLVAQILLVPVLGVTGLLMWFGGGALLAWFAHVAAFAVVAPLVLGHLYLALVNRETRKGLSGVFDGTVAHDWAAEHHPLWVAEEDARLAREAREAQVLERLLELTRVEDPLAS